MWFFRLGYPGKPSASIQRFDAQSFGQLGSGQDNTLMLNLSVSDDSIAELFPRINSKVGVRDPSGEWSQVLGQQKEELCVGAPTFVNNSRLLVAGCSHVVLVDITGKVLLDHTFDKSWHVESFINVSRNGSCAAVSLMKIISGAFDTSVRRSASKIIIYDCEQPKRLSEVEITPPPKSTYSFAISPDGAFLAVLTDPGGEVISSGSLIEWTRRHPQRPHQRNKQELFDAHM